MKAAHNSMSVLRCIGCGKEYPSNERIYTCQNCHDLLEVVNLEVREKTRPRFEEDKKTGIWRYGSFLDINPSLAVSLGEGNTPLLRSHYLEKTLGLSRVYLKCEHLNPTGSFKDRGMAVGVTKARELGCKSVVCASTGNTSASLAAYAATAGLRALVFLPKGNVATGKLTQTIAYGAEMFEVNGNFDQAFETVTRISEMSDLYLLNSINPWRIEGQKTAAFEIMDELSNAPDYVVVPMGNCGNISAYWKGFKEFYDESLVETKPLMIGVQAIGSSPVTDMILEGKEHIENVNEPITIASAIRIGRPTSWRKAKRAIEESEGTATKVSDGEILAAQVTLARHVGLGVEPAGAVSLAGLSKLVLENKVKLNRTFVLVLTGQLLKDPESVKKFKVSVKQVEPGVENIRPLISA